MNRQVANHEKPICLPCSSRKSLEDTMKDAKYVEGFNGRCNRSINNKDLSTRILDKLRSIPCAGFLIAVMSAVCFATASFIVKLLPDVNAIEIVVTRSIVQMIVYLPIIIYNGYNWIGVPGERIHSLLRGLLGFISFGLCYTSYRMIPLADASTILFSSPVYVSVFAWIILKEECGLFQTFTIIMTLIGVMLVSRPTFIFGQEGDSNHMVELRTEGSIIAFISSLASSMVFVIIRKMKNTPSAVVINVFSLVSIVLGIVYLVLIQYVFHHQVPDLAKGIGVPKTTREIGLLIANGLCGVLGQLCLTVSLKIEEAGLVSLARTVDILMAFIYQIAFLSHESNHMTTSVIGAVVVATSVCVTGLRRWLSSKPGKCNWLWAILACGKERDQLQV